MKSSNPKQNIFKSNTSKKLLNSRRNTAKGNKTILDYVNKRLNALKTEKDNLNIENNNMPKPLYKPNNSTNPNQIKSKSSSKYKHIPDNEQNKEPIKNNIEINTNIISKNKEFNSLIESNDKFTIKNGEKINNSINADETIKIENFEKENNSISQSAKSNRIYSSNIQNYIRENTIDPNLLQSDDINLLKEELIKLKKENYILKTSLEKSKKRITELETFIEQNCLEGNCEKNYSVCPKPTPYAEKYNDKNFDYKSNTNTLFIFSPNFSEQECTIEENLNHVHGGKSGSTTNSSNIQLNKGYNSSIFEGSNNNL